MGRYVFKLPDVGEGTAEAEVVTWHVKPGDTVHEDQPLVDVMTDKATVEITSPVSGTVSSVHGEPGEMAAVGAALVVLEVEGAGNAQAEPAAAPVKAEAPSPKTAAKPEAPAPAAAPEARAAAPEPEPSLPKPAPAAPTKSNVTVSRPPVARVPGERPLASPAVRRRARELGIELQFVAGSGPAGRIEHADLDAFIAGGGRTPMPVGGGGSLYALRDGTEEIKVIGLRRKIAEKMAESKRRIPHFMYAEEVDVTELEALRTHLNATRDAGRPKLTLLPFIIRALVRTLPEHPQINSRFDDEAGVLTRYDSVHCGIATQTANGLMVPVVRHAEALDVWGCAAEIVRVSTAARDGSATKEELTGSTITVTSLGPLGGVVHAPVVNYPEVAIVGPNKIIDRPVVQGGQVVVRKMMNVSSSFDHRIVDGWDAAEFIQKIKAALEHPATLFMD
jgi:2-oxoisovalerate dehydrogenase E2 component (dihydrolipoyl transacylase)